MLKKIKKGCQLQTKNLKKSDTQSNTLKTTETELTERFKKSVAPKKPEVLTQKDVSYVLLGEKSNLQDDMT